MPLFAGPDQKQQLLEKLMQQYQENASRAAGLAASSQSASPGAVAGVASLRDAHPFGGAGLLTHPVVNLAQALIARLGPGGVGHPIVGRESSPGWGLAVGRPIAPNPHAGGSPLGFGNGHGQGGPAIPVVPANPSINPAPASNNPNIIPLGNGLYTNATTGITYGQGSRIGVA